MCFGVFCWLIVLVSGRVGSDWLMNDWCLMVDKWLRILMFENDDEDVGNHEAGVSTKLPRNS